MVIYMPHAACLQAEASMAQAQVAALQEALRRVRLGLACLRVA